MCSTINLGAAARIKVQVAVSRQFRCKAQRTMRNRKLRIAWSVVWGIGCLLLIVLWVRSHWEIDIYGKQPSNVNGFSLLSRNGAVYCAIGREMDLDVTWRFILAWIDVDAARTTSRHFVIANDGMITIVRVPDWFLLGLIAALVAAPWIRWQFSLRTLLIATTLVAVVLGVIVWAAK
jgi:type VI protein secretion system component VasF